VRIHLSPLQVVGAIAYSAAFPLSGLVGGGLQMLCLFATMPFLLLGYLFGHLGVALTGQGAIYPFALFLAVLLQVCAVLLALNWWRASKHATAA